MNAFIHKPATLVIDDETDICYLLGNILRHKDMPAVFATSLSEASDIIGDGAKFNFIFLDNYLPDGTGTSYISEVKKKCPDCKVIMITAHDNVTDREQASIAGADGFIGKPFSKEVILSTIDRLSR